MRQIFAAPLIALGLIAPIEAEAQDRHTLGFARLFTNDYFADRHDRWRSGGYSFSVLRGYGWQERRPEEIGSLLEYRLRSEVITPERGLGGADDRPYVGAVSFGLHTHFSRGQVEVSLGADVVAIGPQTGVSDFQEYYHDVFSMPTPPGVSRQLEDAVHLGGTAELVWPMRVSEQVSVRPFVEAQAGVENMVRVGADVIFGGVGHTDLLVRDGVSGQLMRGIESETAGGQFSFVAGADMAQVFSSIYLPEDLGFAAEETRWRARAGIHWQITNDMSFFYGATYLSEEAVDQTEGQVVGGVKLNFNF